MLMDKSVIDKITKNKLVANPYLLFEDVFYDPKTSMHKPFHSKMVVINRFEYSNVLIVLDPSQKSLTSVLLKMKRKKHAQGNRTNFVHQVLNR